MIQDLTSSQLQTATAFAPLPPRSRQLRTAAALTPSVRAAMSYMLPTQEQPFNYAFEPPAGTPWENYEQDPRIVSIYDSRCERAPASIEVEGFELWDAPCTAIDFSDRDAVIRHYYPELIELAIAATGARHAYVFDHLVRQQAGVARELGFGRAAKSRVAAANGRVHNDYTEASGRRRLGMVLGDAVGDGAGNIRYARYSIVNIWRSIKAPVLDTPLAVCDARTIAAQDLVEAQVRYPNRLGEIYLVTHSPKHRWSYFPHMDLNEALVFKQYDSQLSGVARYTPHAAFVHPHAPEDAVARVSIEARCLVLYDSLKGL